MWLVCTAHPDPLNGICLGKRLEHGYYRPPSAQELQKWYDAHEFCVPERDHFKLAFDRTPNYDQSTPAPPIAKHVRLELVKTCD